RGADDDERARQRNVKGLRIVLTEASLMLNAEEQDVTDRLINGAHAVLPKYQEALASLTTAHAQMTGLVATGRANIDELVKATGSLADTGKAIVASAASLASPTTALARHAEQIKDVTGKFAVGVTQISTNLPSVRDGLAEVLASVRDLNRQLHELAASQAEGLRAETAARTAAIGQLASTQHDLARSIDAGRTNVAELVQATGALANGGTAMATNAIELKANVGALVTSTEKLDSVVGSLVSGTREMNAQLPVTHQGTLDLLGAIRDLAKLMQDIYVRQEVVAQELGVLADNPLATAQAAKRTADLAKQTETALANTVNALPVQIDKLRAAVVATLEQEIQERKAAARSVGKSVESFSGAAVDVVNSLRSAIEELRRAPEYVLPDLRRAGVELAQVLQQGQALVQALTRSAEAARQAVPGRRPRLWGWWRRDDRVGR
ncbi:MAG TPA: hypothetical protein VEO01_02225, partial [Pseudonocardiaceae bacterium]|nr:hypothetical protein [Pseudonocardiaceae bacterium]